MITLHGITWDHPRGYAPLRAAEKPLIEQLGVRVIWKARSLKDFGDASLEILARNFDLLVIDHPHVGAAAASGCVVPLDTLLPDDVLSELHRQPAGPSFSSYHYAGHLWALPVDAACQVSSARPDLMAQEKIPTSWEEVFQLAEHLQSRGLHVGMALCPTDALCSFLTLCAQQGDGPTEGNPILVKPETGIFALTLLRRLRQICHPDSLQWNPIKLYDRMTSFDDIAYSPLAFGYTNYARAQNKRPLRFAGIPGISNALLGGAGVAVSSLRPHAQTAAECALWLCGAEYQSNGYVSAGGQPAHGAAWSSSVTDDLAGKFFNGTFDTLRQAYVRPRHHRWPALQEILGNRVSALLNTNESPATAIVDMEIAYQNLIASPR